MTTIGSYEATTRFSELLERAENGESLIITGHGKVAAELTFCDAAYLKLALRSGLPLSTRDSALRAAAAAAGAQLFTP